MRLALTLTLALTTSAAALAGEEADAAFAPIEGALAELQRARAPEERMRLLVELHEACTTFLDEHLADGSPEQVERAGGTWLELAMRSGTDPERILARIAALRGRLDPMPPRLERACQIVESRLRLRPGQPAPTWTAPDVHGEGEHGLADLKGKLVLLDFWATWCAPCIQLARARLAPIHRRYAADDRFALVGVGSSRLGETPEKQATLAARLSLPWTKVFDEDDRIASAYGAESLPYLCLVDPEGKILVIGRGAEVIDEIDRVLVERLGEGGPKEEEEEEATDEDEED